MKNRFLMLLILTFCILSNIYAAEDDISLVVNKKQVECSVPPVIVNNRTLVPARALFESLGAECIWDPETREVEIKMDETLILLTINSLNAYVNDEIKFLDVSPIIINSRTMLPVRFIAEELGFTVEWIPGSRTVDVISPDYVEFIKEISTSETKKSLSIDINLGSPLSDYKIYPLDSPKRLVLELSGFNLMTPSPIEIGKNNIQQIRMANHEGFFKIVIDLDMYLPYKFNISDNRKKVSVVITYAGDAQTPTPSATPSAKPTASPTATPSVSATPSAKPTVSPTPAPTPLPGKYFSENPLVVIDAGHGGNDGGTAFKDSEGNIILKEKDINLDIANKVVATLEEMGIRVETTRSTDVFQPLKGRSEFANEIGADLFVSIHVNYFDNPASSGSLTLYSKAKDEKYADKMSSKDVAQIIQDRLFEAIGTRDAGIRSEDDLSVLRNTTMPAVLIETGFISNEYDRSVLSDPAKRTEAAYAIAEGIKEVLDSER